MRTKTTQTHIKKNPNIIRHPDYVYIGRGSKFGNPFSHIDISTALVKVETRDEAVDNHKKWLNGEIKLEMDPPSYMEIIEELQNRILGCFCNSDQRCHGDNYISIIENYEKENEIRIEDKDLF